MPQQPAERPTPSEIVDSEVRIEAVATTDDGYSFLILAEGQGEEAVYWWHCGACWADCRDTAAAELIEMGEDFAVHRAMCPGMPFTAELKVMWADGRPPTVVQT